MTSDATRPGDLEAGPVRGVRWLLGAGVVAAIAVVAWWVTHPAALPTTEQPRTATTAVGTTVYVGVLGPTENGARTLHVHGADVSATDDGPDADVAAWVCRGGSIAQSTGPERFCDAVLPAEGTELRLGGGDQLLVSVTSDEPGTVTVPRVELAFRDGFQWGSQVAGSPLEVEVLGS